MNPDLITKIKERLPLLEDKTSNTFGNTPRLAAVMIPMYFIDNELHLPFIVRPDYGGVHGGQISFAGGKTEETDPTPIYTAIRETQEEIGVEVSHEQVIGVMPKLYVVPSNMLVTPVVAYLNARPTFTIDPNEVDRVLEVKITDLQNPANHSKRSVVMPNNIKMQFPSFLVQGVEIWGATARMLSEFFKLIA